MNVCDHTSVGIIVRQMGRMLLIERRKPPFGFAPPAGHVDGDAEWETAARRELQEETGLIATGLRLLGTQRLPNRCRRPGGSWHQWRVYEAVAAGTLHPNPAEVKRARFWAMEEIVLLARRTLDYRRGIVDGASWEREPGLEPVWFDWFQTLRVLPADRARS